MKLVRVAATAAASILASVGKEIGGPYSAPAYANPSCSSGTAAPYQAGLLDGNGRTGAQGEFLRYVPQLCTPGSSASSVWVTTTNLSNRAFQVGWVKTTNFTDKQHVYYFWADNNTGLFPVQLGEVDQSGQTGTTDEFTVYTDGNCNTFGVINGGGVANDSLGCYANTGEWVGEVYNSATQLPGATGKHEIIKLMQGLHNGSWANEPATNQMSGLGSTENFPPNGAMSTSTSNYFGMWDSRF